MSNTTIIEDRFTVVVNEEEQYSLWPESRGLPAGWRPTGHTGTRVDCLESIAEVWTDLRPLSLRTALEGSK